jgi:hypothetical protein
VPGPERREASRPGATTLCGTEREREVSSYLIRFLVWSFINIERGDPETALLLLALLDGVRWRIDSRRHSPTESVPEDYLSLQRADERTSLWQSHSSTLLEIIAVDLLDAVGVFLGDTDTVLDH